MGIRPPKPEYRTADNWTPRVFQYDPKRALNIQRLKGLRTHPGRDNPDILANEIRQICKERPLHTWSQGEKQVFCNLFGNNNPGLGITLMMAIRQIDIGLGQQVARLLTSNDLEGRRSRRAAMHGKNLECISRLRIATQQRRGLILN